MKRRVLWIFLVGFVSLSLTACKIEDTGLSEKELGQVAEYSAKLLLKYARGYKPNLLEHIEVTDNPSLVKEDFDVIGKEKEEDTKPPIAEAEKESEAELPKETEEEKEKPTQPADEKEENSEKVAKKLSDIYQVKGLEMVYGGSGEFMKFPENEGYFSLVPPDGMKLYVTSIIIKNISEGKQKFVHDKNIKYLLTFQSGKVYKPSVTFLENDLKFLDLEIEAGKSSRGVLVFNIPKKEKISEAKLSIFGNQLQYEISVSQ